MYILIEVPINVRLLVNELCLCVYCIPVGNEPEGDLSERVSWLHLFVSFVFIVHCFVAVLEPCLVRVTGYDW